jgi:RimJ/RimL family protein N-acetyltransferase
LLPDNRVFYSESIKVSFMSETTVEPAVLYEPPIPQDSLREGRVILRDGTTAILRPAREDDYDRAVELLESLSERSRYQRFFSGSTPVDQMAERLLVVGEPENRYTLVVLAGEPEDQKIIGLGSYSREETEEPGEPVAAEPAFLVHEDYQGRGIGSLLLERLALLAVRHGIDRFKAYTLPDNEKMKEVFESSGFDVDTSSDRGSYIVSFPVTPSQEMVTRSELRDRIATVASLKPFFEPSSVAVIGASRDRDSIGHRILTSLVQGEFNGPVYPVNPAADTVASMPAYNSVLDID